jgi:hypothetical protein
MKKEEAKKKLSKEQKAELLAEVMAAAKGRICFPEALAEARKFGELLKKGEFSPGINW